MTIRDTLAARRKLEVLRAHVERQRRWIADHGGDVAGYRETYGGDAGDDIYAADLAVLRRLEITLAAMDVPHITIRENVGDTSLSRWSVICSCGNFERHCDYHPYAERWRDMHSVDHALKRLHDDATHARRNQA